jgi:hypothetical protein
MKKWEMGGGRIETPLLRKLDRKKNRVCEVGRAGKLDENQRAQP